MAIINDTTLRDGEQTPGVAFRCEEKVAIAIALEKAGVDELEIGIPAMGARERETIQQICHALSKARTMAWCRLFDKDIEACRGLDLDWVDLSIPVSAQQRFSKLRVSEEELIRRLDYGIKSAENLGLKVCLGMEDASRADSDTLARVAEAAQKAGAERIRFADTLGLLDPFQTCEIIQKLVVSTDLAVEMHAHNDLGLATANSLAAIRAGAQSINTTVNGLGERAGNAALEEIALALTVHQTSYPSACNVDLKALHSIAQLVSEASGRQLTPQKCAVGEAIFTHESGLHIDGLRKDKRNYQAFQPELLGRKHSLVLGKHSGLKAIRHHYRELGYQLNRDQESQIRDLLVNFTETQKRIPTDSELREFIFQTTDINPQQECFFA